MKRTRHNIQRTVARRGFSLIELLIVLAILVLLASLVAPRLLGSREKANIDAAKTQINMFQSPLEIYSLHMGGYPTTEQGLMALIEAPAADASGGDLGDDEFGSEEEDLADLGGDLDGESMEEEGGANSNWRGPYIKADKLPKDPWGTAYRYEYPGQNNKAGEPDIWSLGPDRKDNTEDDITSWDGKRKEGGSGDDSFDDAGDAEEIDLGE